MSLELAPAGPTTAGLAVVDVASSTLNAAEVYLASLGNDLSRRNMITSLNRAARAIDPALSGVGAWRCIPWGRITAASVRAVMAKLTGSPATRNKDLAALKGV